jgi:hypothetical protein
MVILSLHLSVNSSCCKILRLYDIEADSLATSCMKIIQFKDWLNYIVLTAERNILRRMLYPFL